MPKLPVFAIVRASYRFLIEDFGTILRLSWFLVLAVQVAYFLVDRAEIQAAITAVASGTDRAQSSTLVGTMTIAGLLEPLALSIVGVALYRIILFGDRNPGIFLHIAFGKVEWLFVVLSLGLALVTLPLFAIMLAADLDNLAPFGYFVLLFGLFIFIYVRFGIMFPIAIVERSLRFREAWNLTSGRSWRLLWILVLGYVPIVIAIFTVELLVGTDPEMAMEFGGDRTAVLRELHAQLQRLPLATAANYAVALITTAVDVGLVCYSYKAIKGYPLAEILTER